MLFFLALLFVFSSTSCMDNSFNNSKKEKENILISDENETDYLVDKQTYNEYWPRLQKIHKDISNAPSKAAYQLLIKLSSGQQCIISKESAKMLERYEFPLDQNKYTDDLCEVIVVFNTINGTKNSDKAINFSNSTIDWSQFNQTNKNDPANTNKQSQ
ncbi:hypothetical protein HYX58_05190 [Candidatus Dependentiae bacterium]|nr:hypothetical protein [Candidatus Dependentiae bacterium]